MPAPARSRGSDVRVVEDLASGRPRSCSRMTYAASRSSLAERVTRNENGLRKRFESRPTAVSSPCAMKRRADAGRFAERELRRLRRLGRARADRGLDRAPLRRSLGGRSRVNPQHRPSDEPRREDYVFEGHELQDALEVANTTLEDDVRVSEQDGRPGTSARSCARSCSSPSSAGSSGAVEVGRPPSGSHRRPAPAGGGRPRDRNVGERQCTRS